MPLPPENLGPLEKRILRRLLAIVARRYLRKPDLAEFLAIQYPDRRSVLAGLGNELYYRACRTCSEYRSPTVSPRFG